MLNYRGKTKDGLIKAEKKQLEEIFSELDEKMKESVDSLIDEAAFMSASCCPAN